MPEKCGINTLYYHCFPQKFGVNSLKMCEFVEKIH